MIKLRGILLAFIFSCSFGYAQNTSKIVNEIHSLMKLQEKAWNEFDIDGFMKYYWNNDSLMFIGNKSGFPAGRIVCDLKDESRMIISGCQC